MARHSIKGKELAEKMHVSVETLSKWRNNPPPMTLKKYDAIAEALTKLSKIGEEVRGIDLLEDAKND